MIIRIICLRHYLRPEPVLLQLRSQPVAAVPQGWKVDELRLRREDLPRAQPHREVSPRLADLRRQPRDRLVTNGVRPLL